MIYNIYREWSFMDKELGARMLQAVKSNQPHIILRNIAIELRDSGMTQENVQQIFSEFLQDLINHGIESEEDIVRDILDEIVGWGSQDLWLFKSSKEKL